MCTRTKNQIILRTRKGNKNSAPISLKITSMVNPTIRKGSKINHTIGKRNIIDKARGQHKTNKTHKSKATIIVFMISG